MNTTKLDELKKKHKDLQKEIKTTSEEFFKEETKNLFETFPDLKSFSWNQYTPFFADGDPCHFSANTDYFTVNEDSEAEYSEDPKMQKMYKAIKKFLQQFDDEMFETMFGDHCEITVTSDNIQIEEYSHD